MGLLGVVLERFEVPAGPVVLGIILGGRLEEAFVQSLTKSDSLTAFFGRPIAAYWTQRKRKWSPGRQL